MAAKRAADRQSLQKPFLKWAGNKFRIIDRVNQRLPTGRRLIEPFAGSGALFLNSDFDHYLLSDSNADLIALYTLLQRDGDRFIDECRALFSSANNAEKAYYRLRAELNATNEPRRRAALFVYLNRHGYNGLCRYNRKGGFNVPFGRYKRPYFPEQEMRTFHRQAQRAEFRHQSFEKTMAEATQGDVIYCDPPYAPLSPSANFTAYSAGGFDLSLQQRLADLARESAGRGIPVLISNHDTPLTRRLYKGARKNYFHVQRYISCNGDKRNKAGELLALYR